MNEIRSRYTKINSYKDIANVYTFGKHELSFNVHNITDIDYFFCLKQYFWMIVKF